MIVKLTDSSLRTAFVSDVGDLKDVVYRKGANLPFDQEVTLADDEVTKKSLESGALSKLLADGAITIVEELQTPQRTYQAQFTAGAGGQAAYTLPESYTVGNGSLHVYVDGALQPKPASANATYAETNATTVTLTAPAAQGTDVQFIWTK